MAFFLWTNAFFAYSWIGLAIAVITQHKWPSPRGESILIGLFWPLYGPWLLGLVIARHFCHEKIIRRAKIQLESIDEELWK